MLRRATLYSTLILLLFLGALLVCVLPHSLNRSVKLTYKLPSPKRGVTRQVRSFVSKDLWIPRGSERLHHRIESPRSILTAHQRGKKTEIIEKLHGMRCYLQESISEDKRGTVQQIRFLESQEGTYSYTSHLFGAEQVYLAVLTLPGRELTTNLNLDTAFLQGVASEVSLSFSENGPTFQAKKFRAEIKPEAQQL